MKKRRRTTSIMGYQHLSSCLLLQCRSFGGKKTQRSLWEEIGKHKNRKEFSCGDVSPVGNAGTSKQKKRESAFPLEGDITGLLDSGT